MRVAVFDVDGTLVDSQHAIVAALHQACASQGLTPPPAARVRHIIGLSLLPAMVELFPDLTPAARNRMVAAYKQAFQDLRARPGHDEPLFPGVAQVIEHLDGAGWLLALCTGKSRRGVESFLDRHGLGTRFLAVSTADDGPGKPDPAMLWRPLAELGADPDRAVMVGDTVYDMQMARTAGAAAIGVAWGYHDPADLVAAGAGRLVDVAGEIPVALDGLLPTAVA